MSALKIFGGAKTEMVVSPQISSIISAENLTGAFRRPEIGTEAETAQSVWERMRSPFVRVSDGLREVVSDVTKFIVGPGVGVVLGTATGTVTGGIVGLFNALTTNFDKILPETMEFARDGMLLGLAAGAGITITRIIIPYLREYFKTDKKDQKE